LTCRHEIPRTAFAEPLERRVSYTTRDLVVDMSDVTVIDAGSVRVLPKAWEAATNRDLRLRITGAVAIVRRVIQLCGAWERLSGPADDATAATSHDRLRTAR
jgi:anti-anti-sigma factor